jgi:transposase
VAATNGFPSLPAVVGVGSSLRHGQCEERTLLRRGDGLPGEDRQDGRRRHRPLWRGQTAAADAAAERGPAAAQGAGRPAFQVTADLTVQKQRKSAATDADTIASLDEVIALFKRQLRRLEGEIASLINDDPLWAGLDQAFRSLKGVASRTVARLMAELPEIGVLSNKAIAKLAGLAPIANDSGKRNGRRRVRGGRAGPRSILFLIARIVAKYDPQYPFSQYMVATAPINMRCSVIIVSSAKASQIGLHYAYGKRGF